MTVELAQHVVFSGHADDPDAKLMPRLSEATCLPPPQHSRQSVPELRRREVLVRQPLASDAAHHRFHLHPVIEAQLDPVIVAVVVLGQIPMQVLFAAVLVDAAHPALEDREHALGRVGTHVAADILTGQIRDLLVRRELGADFGLEAALVCVQPTLAGDVPAHNPATATL